MVKVAKAVMRAEMTEIKAAPKWCQRWRRR